MLGVFFTGLGFVVGIIIGRGWSQSVANSEARDAENARAETAADIAGKLRGGAE